MSTEPRTAAGRALLADLTMDYDPTPGDVVMPAVREGMARDILAIEVEASAAALAPLDMAVLALAIHSNRGSLFDAAGNPALCDDIAARIAADYRRRLVAAAPASAEDA